MHTFNLFGAADMISIKQGEPMGGLGGAFDLDSVDMMGAFVGLRELRGCLGQGTNMWCK